MIAVPYVPEVPDAFMEGYCIVGFWSVGCSFRTLQREALSVPLNRGDEFPTFVTEVGNYFLHSVLYS